VGPGRTTADTLRCTAVAQLPDGVEAVGVPVLAGTFEVAAEGDRLGALLPPLRRGALELRGFEGKVGEALALSGDGDTTVVAVGLGAAGKLDAEVLRRAAAAFVKAAWRARSGAFVLPTVAGLDAAAASQAVVEGALLAAYRFGRYKSEPKACRLETLSVMGADAAGVERARATAGAACLARDLVNEPAGAMTPVRMAEVAAEVAAAAGLDITVLDEEDIERERLGGLRGVSLGSTQPPRLIQLSWSPPEATATVALVGKGITFDSGGLSIKSAEGMMTMKTDMSGAAAVLAAMSAVPALAPSVRVIAVLPVTENMPGGSAIKPGDVLRFRNGKTAEVQNTDAEGRLVLADALSLAAEQSPAAIVDLATLTGACVVALGREIAGVMGNSDALVGQVLAASERTGEAMWHLPLPDRYRKHIDSGIADIKNIGAPGQAGALSAGLFLREFVGDIPWAHLDIAGPARAESDDGYITAGGTGVGVRTLLELLASFEPPPPPDGGQPAAEG
jgi:leucyl aminopeptidase